MNKILTFLICVLLSLPAFAEAFTDGDFSFTTNDDGTTCTVTGTTLTSGSLEIPSTATYNGTPLTVTAIGDDAFMNKSGLSGKLIIPGSITYIGKYAFAACAKLSGNLELPERLASIGSFAFDGCSGFTGNLIIPEAITSIGHKAFENCSGLNETLYFNAINCEDFNGLPHFRGTKFKNIVIGDNVNRIPANFLYNVNWGYESISGNLTIGKSVKTIGKFAFSGCSGLIGDLTLPESITTIDEKAFNGCSGFSGNLIIPRNVSFIGGDAFSNCSGLNGTLYFNAEHCEDFDYMPRFENTNLKNVVIGDEATRIPAKFMQNTSNSYESVTGTLTIGNNVIEIGENAFSKCRGFTGTIVIPRGVRTIGKTAFSGCSGFAGNLNMPAGITSISYGCFMDCKGLTGILTLPFTLKELDGLPFVDANFSIVKSYNTIPPVYNPISGISTVVFTIENYKATLYVPDESVEAYKASDVWKGFYQILPLSEIETLPKSIALSSTSIELTIGTSSSLAATIMPEDATDKSIFWTTSDESIVTVDAAGKITGVGVGEAIITAFSVNGLSATCKVTVLPRDIECSGISLNLESAEVEEGASVQLAAVVTPDNATDKSVTWSSSDASISTVDASGNVTGVKAGTATITATTANGLTATCKVTVKAKVVESTNITLNLESAEVEEGSSVQLAAVVTPDNATDKSVTWSSSDASIATVDSNGKVTGIKAGSVTITATTANGLAATCKVTVKAKADSAIDNVAADGICVTAEGGEIVITAPEGAVAEVFAITGMKVRSTTDRRISGLAHGIYIVRIAGKVFKVRI